MKDKSVLPLDKAYKDIKAILENARAKSFKAVNTAIWCRLIGILEE